MHTKNTKKIVVKREFVFTTEEMLELVKET